MEDSDRRTNPKKHWNMLRGLSGKHSHVAPNQPVDFDGICCSNPKDAANRFMRQYASPPNSSKVFRSVKKELKKLPRDRNYRPFLPADTSEAIRQSKHSTATGHNGLAPWHLKHLGPLGVEFLTAVFNLSLATAKVPSIWKLALVIPILKPGKPANKGSSYRPISLLCPAVKVLERLLLPTLNEHLSLASHQHGFRSQRSTTSAL